MLSKYLFYSFCTRLVLLCVSYSRFLLVTYKAEGSLEQLGRLGFGSCRLLLFFSAFKWGLLRQKLHSPYHLSHLLFLILFFLLLFLCTDNAAPLLAHRCNANNCALLLIVAIDILLFALPLQLVVVESSEASSLASPSLCGQGRKLRCRGRYPQGG